MGGHFFLDPYSPVEDASFIQIDVLGQDYYEGLLPKIEAQHKDIYQRSRVTRWNKAAPLPDGTKVTFRSRKRLKDIKVSGGVEEDYFGLVGIELLPPRGGGQPGTGTKGTDFELQSVPRPPEKKTPYLNAKNSTDISPLQAFTVLTVPSILGEFLGDWITKYQKCIIIAPNGNYVNLDPSGILSADTYNQQDAQLFALSRHSDKPFLLDLKISYRQWLAQPPTKIEFRFCTFARENDYTFLLSLDTAPGYSEAAYIDLYITKTIS